MSDDFVNINSVVRIKKSLIDSIKNGTYICKNGVRNSSGQLQGQIDIVSIGNEVNKTINKKPETPISKDALIGAGIGAGITILLAVGTYVSIKYGPKIKASIKNTWNKLFNKNKNEESKLFYLEQQNNIPLKYAKEAEKGTISLKEITELLSFLNQFNDDDLQIEVNKDQFNSIRKIVIEACKQTCIKKGVSPESYPILADNSPILLDDKNEENHKCIKDSVEVLNIQKVLIDK